MEAPEDRQTPIEPSRRGPSAEWFGRRRPPDRLAPMAIPIRASGPSRRTVSGALCGILAGGFLLASGSARAAPTAGLPVQTPADLAGLWELDPEHSDDPAEVMERAMARAEEGGGRRGRRGRGPGPGRPGGMEPPGAGGPGGVGNRLLRLPDLLEIESGSGELRLVLEERVQILYLDGEEHVREDGRGGRITTVAEFRGGIARVREERSLPMGKLEVFRTLQATDEVLVVRTELKMPRRGDPVLLRTVYRRVP